MSRESVAAALVRVESVFRQRPGMGLHDDVPARVRWEGDSRFVATHPTGISIATDMPTEIGGTGDQATPGWLFRAGVASCTATNIAWGAALAGIDLDRLEVQVDSRSDARGLFGHREADGTPVYPGSRELAMRVQIAAKGVAPERLRAIVETAATRSPIGVAVETGSPLALTVEIGEA